MIYEFRTYTLHVRTMPEFLKRFGEALPRRLELSPLAACWYTELGPLNQVIHVWPYHDMNERTRIPGRGGRIGRLAAESGGARRRDEVGDPGAPAVLTRA